MQSGDDSSEPAGPTILKAFEALVSTLDEKRIRYGELDTIMDSNDPRRVKFERWMRDAQQRQ